MGLTAVTACPQDAAAEVRKACSYILTSRGGEGAVREFAEILLNKQGTLASCQEALWGQEAKGE